MGARESIENLWDRATPVAPLLDAYRAEVLREAAEKLRAHWYPRFPGKSEYTRGMDDGLDKAADLIAP